MSCLNKNIVLCLNKLWIPIGTSKVRDAVVAMHSSLNGRKPARALDVEFAFDSVNGWDFNNVVSIRDVGWEEWISLPIRAFDEVIHCSKFDIRAPTLLVSSHYDKIPLKELKPTNKNIMEYYGYRCYYTNKILPKNRLNIDHPFPKSRGGKSKCWTNMAPCDKMINFKKGDKTPEEAGLKPQYKLVKPKPVPAVSTFRAEHPTWIPFLISKNDH